MGVQPHSDDGARRRNRRQSARRGVPRHRPVIARARLLENGVQCLFHLRFTILTNKDATKQTKQGLELPARHVILHYPHVGLYGGQGWREAYIHDNGTEYILEAKYQNDDGSVDEKLPHIKESFLASAIPNWIVWFDGHFWTRRPRGINAIAWLQREAEKHSSENRKLYICVGSDDFNQLARRLFDSEGK